MNDTKAVLDWDPDFTKVSCEEAIRIEKAEKSGFVDENKINGSNIEIDDESERGGFYE